MRDKSRIVSIYAKKENPEVWIFLLLNDLFIREFPIFTFIWGNAP